MVLKLRLQNPTTKLKQALEKKLLVWNKTCAL